jgi:hypothetical protein
MVVTSSDRKGRAKQLQSGNRECATAIECVSADGFVVPAYLIVQGKHHLAPWNTECGLPPTWAIKTSPNGWTDNDTGLDWIKHFNQHTRVRTQGVWRMIVLDGHESHLSAQFDMYCKENNIITLCVSLRTPRILPSLLMLGVCIMLVDNTLCSKLLCSNS